MGPLAERTHRLGWAASVPNAVLLRMMVMNLGHDAARAELGHRNVYLYNVDPHWTRDIMVSFADAYDHDGVGNGMIFNRFYALYQCSKDAGTLALAESWLSSPSVGKRITASGMMTVDGFCPKEERLRLPRPLLSDPDVNVQTHALRALTFDATLPLDELLAFVNAPHQGLWSGEMNAALSHYNDPLSRAARLRLAADTSSGWSDLVTWSLLHEAFDFSGGTVTPGAIRTLAKARAVPPTARTAWSRNASFRLVYSSLIDAAIARPGSDGEDAETAAWCRSALVSYATTPPMAVPGAPASLVPAILLVVDDQIKAESDPAIKRRLLDLRKAISPETLGEDETVPGDTTNRL